MELKMLQCSGEGNIVHIQSREKKLRSLKGQLQAARGISKGIFPEIHRFLENESNLASLYIKKA